MIPAEEEEEEVRIDKRLSYTGKINSVGWRRVLAIL